MEIESILKYIKLYTGCTDHALKRIKTLLEESLVNREIIKIVEKTNEVYIQKKKTNISIKKFATNWLEKNQLTYQDIAAKTRKRETLTLRNRFCVDAYKEGYGYTEIGRYLKRDHSTIMHCVNKIKTI